MNLEIEQIFNELANSFENKTYHILKVEQHIPRIQEEPSIDFDNNKVT